MRYWYLLNSTMTLKWIKMPQSRGCAWIITIRNSQRTDGIENGGLRTWYTQCIMVDQYSLGRHSHGKA